MKKFLLTLLLMLPFLTKADDYKPMLEAGKTWKYTMVCPYGLYYPDYKTEIAREYDFTMTLQEPIMWEDGNLWYPVLAGPMMRYGLGGEEEYTVLAHLSEDEDGHTVNVSLPEWDYTPYMINFHWLKNGKLFDFDEYKESQLFDVKEVSEKSTFMCEDGEHACGIFEWGGNQYALVEGIGVVCLTDDIYNDYPTDVFGVVICDIAHNPCTESFPHLYEVTDGNGNVIYENSNFRAGCTLTGIESAVSEVAVQYNGYEISVNSPRNAKVIIYNTQGVTVGEYLNADGQYTISTKDMPKGMYIVSVNGYSQKIFVK